MNLYLKVIPIKYQIVFQIWWLIVIFLGDPFSRVACETLTTTNKVVLSWRGERTLSIKKEDLIQKVRNCIKDIGYDQDGFTWKEATIIESHLHSQSKDIAMGVDSSRR